MARAAASGEGTASAGVKTAGAMIFVVVMALVVLLIVRARPGPEPFDPRSGQPNGARGLVLTLEGAGADVVDTGQVPSPGDRDRVLVLDDRLDEGQRDRVLDFAVAGGVVVVADPDSALLDGSGVDDGAVAIEADELRQRTAAEREANVLPGVCDIGALREFRGVFVPDGVLFPVDPGEQRCFTEGDNGGGTGSSDASTAFAIARPVGAGVIVGLGDNRSFTNRYLRNADNAGVVVALLVPETGVRVTFLVGQGASPTVEDVGSGDESLRDLVPSWVWMSLVLGAVGFVVFAISRSARVGRIVSEPLAAPIAGSELVSATGNLMQRAGHSQRAGSLLLARLHRDLCRSHEVRIDAPLDELDRAVADRSGTAPGQIERLLHRSAVGNADLVELSASIDAVRTQVLGDATDASAEATPAGGSISDDPTADPTPDDPTADERLTTS